MIQDKIKDALQDRLLSVVADCTGLHRHTIAKAKRGEKIVSSATKVLADYLGVRDDTPR